MQGPADMLLYALRVPPGRLHYTPRGNQPDRVKDVMTDSVAPDQMILAIDTSTEQAGIGLFANGHVASLSWHAGRSQTITLLDQVHRMLALGGIEAADLTGIAVATGPGAFTGLRVGMSVAKGFNIALGVPLIGISTLAAAAFPILSPDRVAIAVVSAGRSRIAWQPFSSGGDGSPTPLEQPLNSTLAELAEAVLKLHVPLIIGEFSEMDAAVLVAHGAHVVPASLRLRRPESLLALASHRFACGEFDDPVTLEPVYLGR